MIPRFKIQPVSTILDRKLKDRIDQKTKPIGALGVLESIAFKIGRIQQTETPTLSHPHIVVFAGDHGVAKAGVSAYPQEVTHQMVMNFLNNGAAINVFTQQHNIELLVVDAGVNHDFGDIPNPRFLSRKVGFGTRNYLKEAAMTEEELVKAVAEGVDIVDSIYQKGCNIIGFGEMGIGNTSSASLIMTSLFNLPLELCVGSGTGLDASGVQQKRKTLQTALDARLVDRSDSLKIMQTFGGFELAMMLGAFLRAGELGMTILVDGFITSAVFLCALRVKPAISDYVLFTHCSKEAGHCLLLKKLSQPFILNLDLRLGEGTGCALAYPIIESAIRFLNEMASFESASVSKRNSK